MNLPDISPSGPQVSVAETKAALRQTFLTYRASLTAAEHARRSALICNRAASLPELQRAQVVHVYYPLTKRGEIDTLPLIEFLHANKKQVVLPVVKEPDRVQAREPRMIHRVYASGDHLAPNRWGIFEPVEGNEVEPGEIDLVVVPALGVGLNGHRVGYGKGYYDEWLGTLAAPSVCLAFGLCVVDRIPAEPHDVPVSIIVTEDRVLFPAMT